MQATTDTAATRTAVAESAVYAELAATCLNRAQALMDGRTMPDVDLFDLAVLADAAIDPEDSHLAEMLIAASVHLCGCVLREPGRRRPP